MEQHSGRGVQCERLEWCESVLARLMQAVLAGIARVVDDLEFQFTQLIEVALHVALRPANQFRVLFVRFYQSDAFGEFSGVERTEFQQADDLEVAFGFSDL